MYLKRTMAEGIHFNAVSEPFCHLFCPAIEEWIIDFHAWMADVAYKREIRRERDLQGQMGFAFT